MRGHLPRETYRKSEEIICRSGCKPCAECPGDGRTNPVQNVLEMAVLGESASQETYLLRMGIVTGRFPYADSAKLMFLTQPPEGFRMHFQIMIALHNIFICASL